VRFRAWKLFAAGAGAAAGIALSIVAAIMAAGVYNVAASVEHLYLTDRVIEFVLRRSIAVRASAIDLPSNLDDRDLIRLGAEHFKFGCAPCHGDTNKRQNPVVSRMYPAPPPLQFAARDWTLAQLSWIVEHGIKFTGMPAWAGAERGDEVWPVVAYLREMARGEGSVEADDGTVSLSFNANRNARVAACARCHGGEGEPPISDLVPALHGQPAMFLRRALDEYRNGLRASGMMRPVAADVPVAALDELAGYYAALDRPSRSKLFSGGNADRGEEIARRGIPSEGLPPCLACHSDNASENFPRLSGLSATYLKGQLALWQNGLRARTTYGAIMAPIAKRLSSKDIDDVATYFAGMAGAPSSGGASPDGGGPQR
jgi:cytochrome c553